MAKGNLFQGMARGVVGDVVFTRQDGQQVSRVRNRVPRNPRSNAQLYQRAIMATIMQAYAAGKAIFDHSFQGYPVGSANQRRFMSLNTKKLRSAVSADVAYGLTGDACEARIVGPGVNYPVPFKYQVSEGSLTNNIMTGTGYLQGLSDVPNETIAAWAQRMNLQPDDIFTAVGFNCASGATPADVVYYAPGAGDEFGFQTVCDFMWARLRVKSSVFNDATVISNAVKWSQIFEYDLESQYTPDLTQRGLEDGIFQGDELPHEGELLCAGVIRSRDNQDLRSTCVLEWSWTGANDCGLTTDYLLTAWAAGATKVGDSDLILEGGQVQRAPASASRTVNVTTKTDATATVYGLQASNVDTEHTAKVANLVTTDGRSLVLYSNSARSLSYAHYLVIKDGSYGWDTLPAGTTIPDAQIVEYYGEDDPLAPKAEIIEFLLQQGLPSDVATGVVVLS